MRAELVFNLSLLWHQRIFFVLVHTLALVIHHLEVEVTHLEVAQVISIKLYSIYYESKLSPNYFRIV